MAVKKIKKYTKKKHVKKVVVKKKKTAVVDKPKKDKRIKGRPYKYAEYLIFIDWVATAKIERDPETQAEFGKKYGINNDTISEWKKKEEFWSAVEYTRRKSATENTGDIIKKLYIVGLGGDVQAMRTYLQYTGELIEKKQNDLGASPELIEAVERMRKFLPD